MRLYRELSLLIWETRVGLRELAIGIFRECSGRQVLQSRIVAMLDAPAVIHSASAQGPDLDYTAARQSGSGQIEWPEEPRTDRCAAFP
jgi:hypothetical protein